MHCELLLLQSVIKIPIWLTVHTRALARARLLPYACDISAVVRGHISYLFLVSPGRTSTFRNTNSDPLNYSRSH